MKNKYYKFSIVTFLIFIFLPSLALGSKFNEIKKALKEDSFGKIIPEEFHNHYIVKLPINFLNK